MRQDKGAPLADGDTVDVLVFGSGAAGMTAALVAALEGLEVRLCEKSDQVGGTTATSGGTLWVPGAGRHLDQKASAAATEQARAYLRHELGDWVEPDLLEAFLASAPEAIRYLDERSEVHLQHAPTPDYHADAPHGSASGHGLTAQPFDGRLLQDDFAVLRAPWPVFLVVGGMMVGRREIPMLVRPFRSWGAFKRVVSLMGRQLMDRLRYPRGTRLLIGNALVARYLVSLRQRGVPISCGAKLIELRRDGDRVTGAVIEHRGVRKLVHVRRGVVLATGGIAHDKELRSSLLPAYAHDLSMAYEGNTGDGVRAARAVGADLDTRVVGPAYWSPGSIRRHADGRQTLWIHGHMDRGKPGLIAVGQNGRRFVNEADSYHDFVVAMYGGGPQGRVNPAWLICDHHFVKTYGLGLIRPLISPIGPFVRDGYVIRAAGIGELARRTGIDEATLVETVSRYNQDARQGVDREFGRGERVLNRFNGDPDHKPNPCVAPIERGPFYALRVEPCSIGNTVGLRTDVDGRVLEASGQPVAGLYACGNDVSSALRGFYPGPGATLGPAVVFAYRVARHLAAD